jgi:ribosome-associated translation inhibitor RaiA
MATVYSSRTCLPKLCCSLAAVGLFIAGILITGAYPHPDLNDHNLNQTNATANGTNLTSTGNFTLAAESLAIIRANNEALYTHLDEVSDQIEENIKQLQKRFSRSPRAIKAMRTLEAAIAMFDQTHPEPEYQISEYATGKRQWKRAPRMHPIELTELLNYEAQKKHHRNKILGDTVAQILIQNTNLSDKIAEEYQAPLGTLKEDNTAEHKYKTRMARSPGSSATTKAETTTEWFLRKLATSPFPIKTIRALGQALNILTHTAPENKQAQKDKTF